MSRSALRTALGLLAAALIVVPTASALDLPALPGAPESARETGALDFAARSSHASENVRRDAHDGWRAMYDGIPAQVQAAVPPQLQPAPLAPPAEPAVESAPAEPDTCANCVAITYDDGPVADTNRLLDALHARDVRATFMVTGTNARENPDLVRRMRDDGHTVGNHTDTHPRLPLLDDAAIAAQLDASSAAIRTATGTSPRWMRPPYGETDARVAGLAGQRGLALALWDVDTLDWQHRNAEITCRAAVDQAQPGSVILMHDIHASTVDAAPCVIDGLRAKGLRPVSLDELIPDPGPGRTYVRR